MGRKSQKWVAREGIIQSLLQRLLFGSSGENLLRYQSFLVLSNFALFSDFWENIF